MAPAPIVQQPEDGTARRTAEVASSYVRRDEIFSMFDALCSLSPVSDQTADGVRRLVCGLQTTTGCRSLQSVDNS
jgi:hypothetical protein